MSRPTDIIDRQSGASSPDNAVEKLVTIITAAEALGVPYFKMQRAAKRGLFPTYRIANSRMLVRVSEVLQAVRTSAVER